MSDIKNASLRCNQVAGDSNPIVFTGVRTKQAALDQLDALNWQPYSVTWVSPGGILYSVRANGSFQRID